MLVYVCMIEGWLWGLGSVFIGYFIGDECSVFMGFIFKVLNDSMMGY